MSSTEQDPDVRAYKPDGAVRVSAPEAWSMQ